MTGHLGEVMQESMTAALTWTRANAERYGIDPDFFRKQDIHIHVPSGAVPKDGPSAGAAMVTALVSLLTNRPIKNRLAMTGEMTLSGVVLPIGGVKEKVLGAKRAGITHVLLPADNEPNAVADLPPDILGDLKISYVRTLDEVLDLALEKEPVAPVVPEPEPQQPSRGRFTSRHSLIKLHIQQERRPGAICRAFLFYALFCPFGQRAIPQTAVTMWSVVWLLKANLNLHTPIELRSSLNA